MSGIIVKPSYPEVDPWSGIVFCGEAPGKHEEKIGAGFVGPSGAILWPFALHFARLGRSEVGITNLSKVRPPTKTRGGREEDVPPDDSAIAYWGPKLVEELKKEGARVVVALGRTAAQYLLQTTESMDELHGVPRESPLIPGLLVLPTYHPASGLREETRENLVYTAQDLALLRNPLEPKKCTTTFYYASCQYPDACSRIYVDTEGYIDDPWCLQWAYEGAFGTVVVQRIEASDVDELGIFRRWLKRVRPTVYMHQSVHDLRILQQMEIDLLAMGIPFEDTLLMAYACPPLPLGLKGLAPRLVGFPMKSFDEVTGPIDDEIARGYLLRVDEGRKRWPPAVGRKHSVAQRAWSIVCAGNDFRRRWEGKDGVSQELRTPVEDFLGSMPKLTWEDLKDDYGFTRYSLEDPFATYLVREPLEKQMDAMETRGVYAMDLATVPIVAAMINHGMLIDMQGVEKLKGELGARIEQLTKDVIALSGDPEFDVNSSDDVADYLFVQKGHAVTRKTKKGRGSTAKIVLKGMADKDVLIPPLLKLREYSKLKSTFVDTLPKYTDRNNRFHPDLHMELFTGRFSAEGFNVLATPQRGEFGKPIRSLFIAPPGSVIISGDLSQIELRVVTILSGDLELMKAYQNGEDIHAKTATNLFGSAEKLYRDPAKTLNFALLYGITDEMLYRRFVADGITKFNQEEVAQMRRDWFKLYGGVSEYIQEVHREIMRTGMVRDMWGRVRHLPAAILDAPGWPDAALREQALRQGFNHKIQGGAQGMMRRGMIRFWELRDVVDPVNWRNVHPLLQVHDELLVECLEADVEYVSEQLKRALIADSDKYPIPIEASVSWGPSWGEAKK
jgi:uracil-DNA glycosylase family 4